MSNLFKDDNTINFDSEEFKNITENSTKVFENYYESNNLCHRCNNKNNCSYLERINEANKIYERLNKEALAVVIDELGPNPNPNCYVRSVNLAGPIIVCNNFKENE